MYLLSKHIKLFTIITCWIETYHKNTEQVGHLKLRLTQPGVVHKTKLVFSFTRALYIDSIQVLNLGVKTVVKFEESFSVIHILFLYVLCRGCMSGTIKATSTLMHWQASGVHHQVNLRSFFELLRFVKQLENLCISYSIRQESLLLCYLPLLIGLCKMLS